MWPDLLALHPVCCILGQASGRPSSPDNQNDSRSGSVNGGRSDQGNITVDGLDDNDQVMDTHLPEYSVKLRIRSRSVRVTTGNATADAVVPQVRRSAWLLSLAPTNFMARFMSITVRPSP